MDIINDYLSWFKENASSKLVKNTKYYEFTAPILDRHNDHIQIYLTRDENNKIVMTDDGYTINDLYQSGIDIEGTPRKQELLKTILNIYGVKKNNNELSIETDINSYPKKLHSFFQAIININDMYLLSVENIVSLFKEEILAFFQRNSVYAVQDIRLPGKSGFDHNFDFVIAKTNTKPERLIKTINNPKKDSVLNAIMSFNDVVELRSEKPQNMIIFNDLDRALSEESRNAMEAYGIEPLAWSKREDFKPRLVN